MLRCARPRFLTTTTSFAPVFSLHLRAATTTPSTLERTPPTTTTSARMSSSTTTSETLTQHLHTLQSYTACDISDALLKLQPHQPAAGFLANISPLTPSTASPPRKVIAPASTLKLIRKSPLPDQPAAPAPLPEGHPSALPKGAHWVDLTPAGHVVVIESAPDTAAASIGGIMALKMSLNGVAGCVVSGRARDQGELEATKLPLWARAKSSVATGAEAKVWGRECEVQIGGVKVNPGDVVVLDAEEGCVVCIPRALVGEVCRVVGGLVEADERVVQAVKGGMTVAEAFAKFRG